MTTIEAVAPATPRRGLPAPLHYALHTLKLTGKNRGYVVFSLATPLILYVVFSQIFGSQTDNGVAWAAIYMVSMAAYGSLGGAMSGGAQLAVERRSGWFRQLSITGLRPRAFLLAKAAVIMAVVLPALVLVFAAGYIIGGVRAPAVDWLTALLLMWIALVPLTVLGLVIGLWVKAETVQPLTTLVLLVMSLLGGLWFPAQLMPSGMRQVAELMPSYWLAALGRYPFESGGFPWQGVGVLAAWTVVLTVLGALGYRRAAANSKR
jgi:ABC-2 type transport system permease protein